MANPVGGVSMVVRRHASWKRLGHAKPWRVEVFGNPWAASTDFERVEDAQREAEKIARKLIFALLPWARAGKRSAPDAERQP